MHITVGTVYVTLGIQHLGKRQQRLVLLYSQPGIGNRRQHQMFLTLPRIA